MILRSEELNDILDEITETHKESLKKLAGDTKEEDDKEEDSSFLYERE